MSPKTIRLGLAGVIEILAIAALIAIPVVAFSWTVLRVSDPSSFQKAAFFVLNLPAIVIWVGGGENDSNLILARLVILAQWVAIGLALGALFAIVRRLLARKGLT